MLHFKLKPKTIWALTLPQGVRKLVQMLCCSAHFVSMVLLMSGLRALTILAVTASGLALK